VKIYLSNKSPQTSTPQPVAPAASTAPLRRKISRTSINSPMKFVSRVRKMSSPDEKSALMETRKSSIGGGGGATSNRATIGGQRGSMRGSNNAVPLGMRKRISPGGLSSSAVNTIKQALQLQQPQSKPGGSKSEGGTKAQTSGKQYLSLPGAKKSTTSGGGSGGDDQQQGQSSKPSTSTSISMMSSAQGQLQGRLSPFRSGEEPITYDLLNFNPDTSEARELFSKKYGTAEERYRALEARDKLLRARKFSRCRYP
jgi:hypothetical protein